MAESAAETEAATVADTESVSVAGTVNEAEFVFEVIACNLYLLQTARELTASVPVNSVIWLYDVDGRTPITYNDDKFGANIIPPPLPLFPVAGAEDPPTGFLMIEDAEILWRADRTGTVYAGVEPIPYLFGQDYGSNVRYRLVVAELREMFLPVISTSAAAPAAVPAPGPAPAPIEVPGVSVPVP